MGFEAIRKAETDRMHGRAPASPRALPSKAVTDRAAMLADITVRRRRAQMMARHALDAPDAVRIAEPLAS